MTVACALQKVAPKGVDVVYDPVGGKSFEEALKVVKWGAQILIIGFASGSIPKVRHLDSIVDLISRNLSGSATHDLLYRTCKDADTKQLPVVHCEASTTSLQSLEGSVH